MRIGVLALQGDFVEHIEMLKRAGAAGIEVRLPRDLEGIDGLIIPANSPRRSLFGERAPGRSSWPRTSIISSLCWG
jgi:hypothetical protein